jgi:hypothetical protein
MKTNTNGLNLLLCVVIGMLLMAMQATPDVQEKPYWMQVMEATGRTEVQPGDTHAVDFWHPTMGDFTAYFPQEPKGRPSELIRFYLKPKSKAAYIKIRLDASTQMTIRDLTLEDFIIVPVPGN